MESLAVIQPSHRQRGVCVDWTKVIFDESYDPIVEVDEFVLVLKSFKRDPSASRIWDEGQECPNLIEFFNIELNLYVSEAVPSRIIDAILKLLTAGGLAYAATPAISGFAIALNCVRDPKSFLDLNLIFLLASHVMLFLLLN